MWQNLFLLTLTSLAAKIWTLSPRLSFYSLQLTAALVIVYLAKSMVYKNRFCPADKIINAIIITMAVLLLTFSTGGPASPLFFLCYFLLFGIGFLFQPSLTISYSLILAAIFSLQAQSPQDLLSLLSLIFVAPLARLFGKQYLKNLADQKRITTFKEKLLKSEKSIASEEGNTLIWLSLNFRNTLSEIVEITALLLADLSRISPTQKTQIKKIRRKSKKLLKEGGLLKKLIDRETD
ncbi:hypothetical protein KKD61_03480 [Patescibacteria group bacterium]|nr:hypothetical protein [Patescibacteria group bacterium]